MVCPISSPIAAELKSCSISTVTNSRCGFARSSSGTPTQQNTSRSLIVIVSMIQQRNVKRERELDSQTHALRFTFHVRVSPPPEFVSVCSVSSPMSRPAAPSEIPVLHRSISLPTALWHDSDSSAGQSARRDKTLWSRCNPAPARIGCHRHPDSFPLSIRAGALRCTFRRRALCRPEYPIGPTIYACETAAHHCFWDGKL